MSLIDWGWSLHWEARFAPYRQQGLCAARVTGGSRGIFTLETEQGPIRGELSGRLEYMAESAIDLPVAGDWVAVTETDPALITAIVPRAALFARTDDGERQPLAANIDVALLVTAFDRDFSVARLHRYLVLAREAGARPVIVLNKRDLADDTEEVLRAAALLAPVAPMSALSDDVGSLLGSFVGPGETAALLGSSGVGKSTIVNALLGDSLQSTREIRESDSRGRHATTARTLFRLPEGWLLADMPGLRAVGVGAPGEAVDAVFDDISELAHGCRFTDCTHTNEPGCAVSAAVSPVRLASYRKLLREAAYQHRREDASAARALKEKWKKIHIALRQRGDKRE